LTVADMLEKAEGGALARWDPFRELDELRDRIWRSMLPLQERLAGALWSPAADVEETDNAFVVEVELPGIAREDVEVEASSNEIVVRGEVKERERKGILRRRTRRTGSFEYRLSVSTEIDADKVEAKLEKGVLTVTAPKKEPTGRRKVAVAGGAA
jgi:HSP20 family protein